MFRSVAMCVCVCAFALVASTAPVSADAPKPQVLADFEDFSGLKVEAYKASQQQVETEGGHALRIATQAEANYPTVKLLPDAGNWDLSGYEAVKTDFANPGETPVRVLLSINNPGANGRENCNVESVTVAAGGKATLTVPFGSWHGETGHDLDLSNIVSIAVLLDRPKQPHTFLVDNIRAVADEQADMQAIYTDPFFKQLEPTLKQGVNLGNMLEAPREGEWGVRLEESYFDKIAEAGFDHVRLPVRWSAHADKKAPYKIDETFLERVDWAIENALERRLRIVFNMHHYEEIFQDPDGHRERFLAIWEQLAEHYQDAPAAVWFELLNEPHNKLTPDKWNDLAADTLEVIRKTNPNREVVIGPGSWNGIKELPSLQLPADDRNITVTVHYYSPFQFTHQGAGWVGAHADRWLGTNWKGTESEKRAVTRDLNAAIAWAVKNRRPMYLGEFGAYSRADMDSRVRWTSFVAEQAAKRKMSSAYWEFCASFGVYDPKSAEYREGLLQALLP